MAARYFSKGQIHTAAFNRLIHIADVLQQNKKTWQFQRAAWGTCRSWECAFAHRPDLLCQSLSTDVTPDVDGQQWKLHLPRISFNEIYTPVLSPGCLLLSSVAPQELFSLPRTSAQVGTRAFNHRHKYTRIREVQKATHRVHRKGAVPVEKGVRDWHSEALSGTGVLGGEGHFSLLDTVGDRRERRGSIGGLLKRGKKARDRRNKERKHRKSDE